MLAYDRWRKIRLLVTSGNNFVGATLLDDGKLVQKPWSEEDLIAKS